MLPLGRRKLGGGPSSIHTCVRVGAIGNIRLPNRRQEKRKNPPGTRTDGGTWISLIVVLLSMFFMTGKAVGRLDFLHSQICHQDREYIPSDSHPVTTESSQELPVLLSFHPDATQLYTHLDGSLCQLSPPDLFTGPAGAALNIWFCCNHLTFIQRQ